MLEYDRAAAGARRLQRLRRSVEQAPCAPAHLPVLIERRLVPLVDGPGELVRREAVVPVDINKGLVAIARANLGLAISVEVGDELPRLLGQLADGTADQVRQAIRDVGCLARLEDPEVAMEAEIGTDEHSRADSDGAGECLIM